MTDRACREHAEAIGRLVDGELDDAGAAGARAHVAACAPCREGFHVDRKAREALASADAPPMRGDALGRLHASIDARASRSMARPWVPVLIGVTAVVVLATAIVASRGYLTPVEAPDVSAQTPRPVIRGPLTVLPDPEPVEPVVAEPAPPDPAPAILTSLPEPKPPKPRPRRQTRRRATPVRNEPESDDSSIIITVLDPDVSQALSDAIRPRPGKTVIIANIPGEDGEPGQLWSVCRTVSDDSTIDHVEVFVGPLDETPPTDVESETVEAESHDPSEETEGDLPGMDDADAGGDLGHRADPTGPV